MLKKRLAYIALATLLSLSFSLVAHAEGGSGGSADNRYYYGTVVNAGGDGYSQAESIREDDPHYGWSLGQFVVSGFTSRTEGSTPVFLKNTGDEVTLSFVLEQNIDALNGDDSLKISQDEDGYDEYYGVERQDFGRGTLIVRHTDYQNASTEPQIYTDYLPALEVGAETRVDLFEEGDYEVTLDYEVESPWIIPVVPFAHNYTHYRINFRFKVRNSNAMAFLFDTETGSELVNGSVTPNGFRIDAANSHYLEINVRRDVLNSEGDELVEDTRFNRAATDGSTFTDEGIYTVTIKNQTTGEVTTKRIYVGDNEVLKASVANQMDIADVEEQLARGAVVAEDGTLLYPEVDVEPEEESQAPSSEGSQEAEPGEPQETGQDTKSEGSSNLPLIGVVVLVVLAAVWFALSKRGKGDKDEAV